jgi:hypothetical protein
MLHVSKSSTKKKKQTIGLSVANKVTAAEAIEALENSSGAFIQACQQAWRDSIIGIYRQLELDLYYGGHIDIKSWYGSKRRKVIRLKYSLADKGIVLIHWMD